jgi:adenylate kinase family enzyme
MKIAILGKICSGKTTLANKLAEHFKLERIAFGDSVKKYTTEIFYMSYKDRKLIQDFAEKMKEIDNDIWIKHLDKKIKDKNNIIIDDLRFKNEYTYLKKNNFVIIKLVINKNQQIKRIKNLYGNNSNEHIERLNHISELYIDELNADFIVNPEDSIESIVNFIESL